MVCEVHLKFFAHHGVSWFRDFPVAEQGVEVRKLGGEACKRQDVVEASQQGLGSDAGVVLDEGVLLEDEDVGLLVDLAVDFVQVDVVDHSVGARHEQD